jgi:probable HAF family extracellular repeat protein
MVGLGLALTTLMLASCSDSAVRPERLLSVPANASASLSIGAVTDLGSIGGPFLEALAISSNSLVVGVGSTPNSNHAFLWSAAEGIRDLGTLPGDDYSKANGVNSRGQVVGMSTSLGSYHAFIWSADKGMRDLGSLGGHLSVATGINEAGQVVGWSAAPRVTHAFIWTEAEGMKDIGALGTISMAWAINNHGQVVGTMYTPLSLKGSAFVWTKERGMRALTDLGGDASYAFAINDAGVIGGASNVKPAALTHATIWTKGVIRDLAGFGDDASVRALGPNGEAFGETFPSWPGIRHAYRWTEAFGMEDLTNATGLTTAWAVNRELMVVGDRYLVKVRRVGY